MNMYPEKCIFAMRLPPIFILSDLDEGRFHRNFMEFHGKNLGGSCPFSTRQALADPGACDSQGRHCSDDIGPGRCSRDDILYYIINVYIYICSLYMVR